MPGEPKGTLPGRPATLGAAMLRRLDLRTAFADRPELVHQRAALAALLPRPDADAAAPLAAVREILAAVRDGGDAALRSYTARFDGVELDGVVVAPERVAGALTALRATRPELVAAMEVAHRRILEFHRAQVVAPHVVDSDGVAIRSISVPVDVAGCYVPGGKAVYPSTVLMTATVARAAGVGTVVLCAPPDAATGVPAELTLAAAAVAGVDVVVGVGGAQAIAAMAYGTESVPPVDVIVGPGNTYVALAQREVAAEGRVGVPSSFAGPSEVVVVADASAPVDLVAVDLLVQAEHGPDGLAWLITTDAAVADAVTDAVARLTAVAPRRAHLEANFARNGFAVVVDTAEAAMAVANAIAPEHLELIVADTDAYVAMVRHAGAVFTGPWAPASVGDYVAGPSHVLPTAGSARFGEALTVADFTKQVHVIDVRPEGIRRLGPHVVALATAEGLAAHADSIALRLAALDAEGAP